MELNLLDNFPLEQLRDYSIRDRLLNTFYTAHQSNGASDVLAGQFLVRFDALIGLIMNEGLKSEEVRALYKEIRLEFFFHQHFESTLNEIGAMIELEYLPPPHSLTAYLLFEVYPAGQQGVAIDHHRWTGSMSLILGVSQKPLDPDGRNTDQTFGSLLPSAPDRFIQ